MRALPDSLAAPTPVTGISARDVRARSPGSPEGPPPPGSQKFGSRSSGPEVRRSAFGEGEPVFGVRRWGEPSGAVPKAKKTKSKEQGQPKESRRSAFGGTIRGDPATPFKHTVITLLGKPS